MLAGEDFSKEKSGDCFGLVWNGFQAKRVK